MALTGYMHNGVAHVVTSKQKRLLDMVDELVVLVLEGKIDAVSYVGADQGKGFVARYRVHKDSDFDVLLAGMGEIGEHITAMSMRNQGNAPPGNRSYAHH
jgi:hypothetical protein